MKKYFLFFILSLCFYKTYSQNVINVDTLFAFSDKQITNKVLFHDSLASSFCIIIKDQVALHKHLHHAEQVYVVEGEATMLLGDKELQIKPNDLIYIPKNTWHSVKVTSNVPLKVISFQAPYFDGKDRVLPTSKNQGAY